MEAEPRPSPGFAPGRAWFAIVASGLLLLTLWLALHPYRGVEHDAILYTAQALLRLDPQGLQADTAFVHGSQDRFSIFPRLYAPLLDAFGVGAGHVVMAALGQAAWLAALLWLARRLFQARIAATLAAAAVIVLSPYYGGWTAFAYGEPFATARPLAEASVLVAIAASLDSGDGHGWRAVMAAGALGIAFVLHPLMALPGAAVVGLLWTEGRPFLRAAACLGAAAVIGVGAIAGIDPFSRVLQTYDRDWAAMLPLVGYVLLGHWKWTDWSTIASQGLVLTIALSVATQRERRLILAVGVTAVLGVLVSAAAGDLARNVLVVGLQPWRALWLLAVVANLLAPVAVLRLPAGSLAREALCAALTCLLLERLGRFQYLASPLLFVLAAAIAAAERRWRDGLPVAARLAFRLVATITILATIGGIAFAAATTMAEPMGELRWASAILVVAVLPILPLVASGRVRAGIVMALAVVATLAAAAAVDRRGDWTRFVETGGERAEVDAFIAAAGEVYWEGGLELMWLKQRRSAAFGDYQGAGLAFYRGMAIAIRDRIQALLPLKATDADAALATPGLCRPLRDPRCGGLPDIAAFARVCRDIPTLDAVILAEPIPGLQAREWRPPVPAPLRSTPGQSPREAEVFFRYACAPFR